MAEVFGKEMSNRKSFLFHSQTVQVYLNVNKGQPEHPMDDIIHQYHYISVAPMVWRPSRIVFRTLGLSQPAQKTEGWGREFSTRARRLTP
jgi:hypothetical protein